MKGEGGQPQTYRTQREAVAAGMSLVRSKSAGQLVIHGRNGQIRRHETYKMTPIDAATGLPRFNMPLELVLFLGCKRFGPANQKNKRILILDSEPYRYRAFLSDIAGQDIRAHGGDPNCAIRAVRDWLQASSKRAGLAGGGEIIEHYRRFRADLPAICAGAGLEPDHRGVMTAACA